MSSWSALEQHSCAAHTCPIAAHPGVPCLHGAPPSKQAVSLARAKLLFARHKSCWHSPVFLAAYAVFAAILILHSDTASSYRVESAALSCAGSDGSSTLWPPYHAEDVYTWTAGQVLPSVLAGSPAASSSRGVAQSECGLLVGGVVLSQWRRQSVACPLGDELGSDIASATCLSDSAYDTTVYGDASVKIEYAVESAFEPLPRHERLLAIADYQPRALQQFTSVAAVTDGLNLAKSKVEGLEAAGWIDEQSEEVDLTAAVVSLEHGRVTLLRAVMTRRPGAHLTATVTAHSAPLHPYASGRSIIILDGFVIVLVVVIGTILIWRSCRPLVHWHKSGVRPTAAAFESEWRSRWHVLMVAGCFMSLAVLIVSWISTLPLLSNVRDAMAGGQWGISSDLAGGVGAEADTLILHSLLAHAIDRYNVTKHAAVAALAFLTAHGVSYTRLQPQLSIMSNCIACALIDMVHLGLVLGFIIAAYGVAGHIVFGPTAPDWSTVTAASFALVRIFAAWDYDLGPMQETDPVFGAIYLGSFMLLVANALMWVWFTVLIDTYTGLRTALREGPPVPDLKDDVIHGLQSLHGIAKELLSGRDIATLLKRRQAISSGHEIVIAVLSDMCKGCTCHCHHEFAGEESSMVSLATDLATRLRAPVSNAEALLHAYARCADGGGGVSGGGGVGKTTVQAALLDMLRHRADAATAASGSANWSSSVPDPTGTGHLHGGGSEAASSASVGSVSSHPQSRAPPSSTSSSVPIAVASMGPAPHPPAASVAPAAPPKAVASDTSGGDKRDSRDSRSSDHSSSSSSDGGSRRDSVSLRSHFHLHSGTVAVEMVTAHLPEPSSDTSLGAAPRPVVAGEAHSDTLVPSRGDHARN